MSMSMRILTWSLMGLFIPAAPAAGDFVWDWIASPEGDATVRGSARGPDCAVYAVGSFHDALVIEGVTLVSHGTEDVFLIKLDAHGTLVWARAFGAEWLDCGWDVAVAPDGSVVITGDFTSNAISFGGFTLINAYQASHIQDSRFDVFTVGLDPAGEVRWAAAGGGLYDDRARGVAIDRDGFAVSAGRFNSPTIWFDGTGLENLGNSDGFIVRYTPSGACVWAGGIAGSDQDEIWDIVTDSAGQIYVTGSYLSAQLAYGEFLLTNTSNDFDLFLLKCLPGAAGEWLLGARGENWDEGAALAVDGSDDICLTGHFRSDSLCFGTETLYLSEGGPSNSDLYLIKVNGAGELMWARSSTGGAWPYPNGIDVDEQTGDIAIVGEFNGRSGGYCEFFDDVPIAPIASYDIFAVHFDPVGHAMRADVIGGEEMEFAASIHREGPETIISAYFGSSSVAIGDSVLYNNGTNRSFIARQRPSGSGVTPSLDLGLALHARPNPMAGPGVLSYRLPRPSVVRLEVLDVNGRCIRRWAGRLQAAGAHSVAWRDGDDGGRPVPSGAYVCRLDAGGSEVVTPILVVR